MPAEPIWLEREGQRFGPFFVGEEFNPHYSVCGFNPDEDVVSRRTDLTEGQKRLYERGRRWAGGQGRFWYSFKTMAEMLGRASKFGERSVRKDMARLVDAGLIRYQHRLGRRSNTYTFLFHGDFLVFVERNSSSAQIAGEGLPLQDLTGTPVPLSDHAQKFERNPSSAQTQNGADLNGTPVPLKSFEQSISGSLSGTPVPVGMRLSGTPVPPNQLLNLQEEHTDFDASEIFERIYKRHPKKVGKILAERAIASVIADSLNPKAVAAQIERSHAAHCRTPQWIEQGGRFAPKLERWILDRGFLDDLPTNEQSISEYPEL